MHSKKSVIAAARAVACLATLVLLMATVTVTILLFSSIHAPLHRSLVVPLILRPSDASVPVICQNNANACVFHYNTNVDFRIVVLAFNRALSLHKLLSSLDNLQTDGAVVSLDIWIDVDLNGTPDEPTVRTANNYVFLAGLKTVHVQPKHVGVFGQWVNTWRPRENSTELAVILEDDLTVSPYMWRWLQQIHFYYKDWWRVAGYSLQCHNVRTFMDRRVALEVPPSDFIFAYRVFGSWGFAPHPQRWREFQDWVYTVKTDQFFRPYVDGIIPTEWFKGFEKVDAESSMWEMWHVCFTHFHNLLTIYANLPTSNSGRCLAVNRRERGLHFDGNTKVLDNQTSADILTSWSNTFEIMPTSLKMFHYNGQLMP